MADIKIAGTVLAEALTTITKKRPGVHGDAENSFQMIADMWTTYVRHIRDIQDAKGNDIQLRPEHVAQMMVQFKQARALYGDQSNHDNFIDAAGYTALAGMLQLSPFFEPQKEDTNGDEPPQT